MNKGILDYNYSDFLKLSIKDAVNMWLKSLSHLTRKNYSSGINVLIRYKIIDPEMILEDFCYVNHNDILEKIRCAIRTNSNKLLSASSIQARSACYISFTKFLSKWSQGRICFAIPSRRFGEETFFKVRDKIKTNILLKSQWLMFFDELKKVSFRDYLISKLIVQGLKGISDILNLKVYQLDFVNKKILFFFRRRRNRLSSVQITYPESLFVELMSYIGSRKDWVFVSEESGDKISVNSIYKSFKLAERNLCFPFKVTPRVLRASALSHLKKLGFSDNDIIRISGHASLEMIRAYNVSVCENVSSQFSLIL